MKAKSPLPADPAALRRAAEARLQQRLRAAGARSADETARLVHELEVHQIELEMQNEELRETRDELEAGVEKYSDLFDFAPVGYVTLDPDGLISEANLACASLLGLDRSRLLGRRLGLFVAPADRSDFAAFLPRVFASGLREPCEVALLREGLPPVEVRIEAAVAESGRTCRVVLTDLTNQNRAEAERVVLEKLASTGILAGGIAHDFNNLLTVMLLNLDLAGRAVAPGTELAELLAEAKEGALRAQALTAQLITFAAGSAPVLKRTRLAELVRASVASALHGSAVKSDFAAAGDLWWVEVDHLQIAQVIRNVALNAREAMPSGGVLAVRLENVSLAPPNPEALPPGRYVRTTLADQGVGIAPEALDKIFDPYFSTKNRGAQKGMGLGLTICHAIVRKHGGAITVESEPGSGTTCRIHLPALAPGGA